MAIEAELPDGRILEFPDGTSPAVIQATVKRVLASGQPTPETTVGGHVKEAFKGLVPGAVGLLESAATGASALLPEELEKSARAKIASVAGAVKKPFEAAPGYEDTVTRKLSEAVGSTAPFLLAGPFGLAGRAAAVGLGVGAGAGEARTRAEQEGATADQRGTATALGTIPGALEAFAPIRILSRIPTASKAAGVEAVKRAMIAGGEEAAQEAASGFAQNLIARGVYKPEQALIEGLGEQAAYGGATGAIVQGLMDLALGRRAKGTQPTQPAAPAAQGEMFTPAEMGVGRAPVVPAGAVPPTEPAATTPTGQMDLGLDYQREVEQLYLERERLRQQPPTPEVEQRVADLSEQIRSYEEMNIAGLRAQAEVDAEQARQDAEGRKRFPALAEAPDLLTMSDEVKARTQGDLFGGEPAAIEPAAEEVAAPGEPTPVPPYQRKGPYQYKLPLRGRAGELTMKDVEDTGIAPSTTRGWFEQNVVGKTSAEVQALVDADPTLIEGKGKRAKILRELLAPRPATFKEPANVPPTAKEPAPEQRDEPRAGEPSVGVPSEPAAAVVPEPGAGVAGPAAAPVTPDGLGLVPAGQPAEPGAEAQGVEPAAVETAEEEAARKAEAAAMAAALARQQGAGGRGRTAPPAAPAAPRAAQPTPPIPEKLYEPIGTSEFGMEEGQKEILRGPQAMLFPMSKREELEYAERQRGEPEAEEAAPAARDARQGELDFTKEAAPELSAPSTWAAKSLLGSQRLVYEDGEVALVRAVNEYGEVVYFPMHRDGTQAFYTIESKTKPSWITPQQVTRLMAAADIARLDEAELHTAHPDGPFTDGKSVVAAPSVGPALEGYAANLLRSLGLGDIKLFIYTADDAAQSDFVDANKLYGPFARPSQFKSAQLNGSAGPFGTDEKTYAVYLNPSLSENARVEILAHEIGHIIEKEAYNNADAETRKAIADEYLAWRKKAKGATSRELIEMLRNREDAQINVAALEAAGRADDPAAKTLQNFGSYWTGFGEWFADNVSRWATTNEKPLSIADKFFSKLAQKMRDLVAVVTGRKFPPAKSVADYLNKLGPADFRPTVAVKAAPARVKDQFSVSYSTESLINRMGSLGPDEKTGLKGMIPGFKSGMSPAEPSYGVKFRTQVADTAATIEHRLREQFDGAVRDSLGKLNPMGLYRQAQDYTKTLLEYFQVGGLVKDPATGLWVVQEINGVRPPAEVYALIDAWGQKNGYDRERASQIASGVLEGVRLNEMRRSNREDGTSFLIHLEDSEIDQLVAEYNADPDLQAMSKAMDESRIAMVDNMVAVGRLTKETGEAWKDAVGYVPFDRLGDEAFSAAFSKIKKVSNKGLAQLGKLPELVGSEQRPVGNVFENYLNTLGWMVGQTMKSDANTQTLRSLEDLGYAKFLGRNTQKKANAVGGYIDGEMMYWELPSKYDVLAFKDMNPQKAGWLRNLGKFSNVLRKSVTALPPFALKQVTDDIQRAIMTSGVKNPGALLRMSLSNFGGIAFAELRGIQHPSVKQFGKLGLTGEYDFEAGKPAVSLLKDLGYKKRGKFETLLHRLDGITRASDLAVRKAIYDQTLKETNDQLLAQTRAREFINFRRRGASDFVGAMVTTIPFFNAYIQGMDVLYRAASGKDSSSSVGRAQARRMFLSRAAIAMALSSLYALGAGDDEEYQEMDLRTRDSNWILPGVGKLPVPTELGALFKVVPERIVEYMRRQGTPEEQTAWEATRTALTYMFEQYVGRTVPVPQAVKPLLEAWTNYSFFTGRELEGIYQRQQDPSLRRASNTSELAIAIANFSRDVVGVDKVSPILVDNALNGYFGSSAGLLVAMTDSLLNPTRVDRPLHKWALLSNYMYDPVGTRRMTEFYETREKVGRANATLNELAKTDLDRAAAYAEKNADVLMMESAVNSTLEQLERTRAYRKYLNSPDAAAEMSKEERALELQELRKMEVDMTGWLREAKATLGY